MFMALMVVAAAMMIASLLLERLGTPLGLTRESQDLLVIGGGMLAACLVAIRRRRSQLKSAANSPAAEPLKSPSLAHVATRQRTPNIYWYLGGVLAPPVAIVVVVVMTIRGQFQHSSEILRAVVPLAGTAGSALLCWWIPLTRESRRVTALTMAASVGAALIFTDIVLSSSDLWGRELAPFMPLWLQPMLPAGIGVARITWRSKRP